MKKLILIFMFLLITSFNVLAEEKPVFKVGEVDPNGEVVEVEAFGLVCDFCANAIEKVFMRQDQVSGIDVSLEKHQILIALKEGQQLNDDEITKLVLDSGYNVKSINRTGSETDEGSSE
ncbi:MAG: heavy-metal-associated domain-containing protein [Gammaproteobacteria bacterium]